MYIDQVPNRNSPPAILLRESYRENGKVRKRTLANLSHLPPRIIEGIGKLLKGAQLVDSAEPVWDIVRTRPHGHVAAVLGTVKRLGLDRVIDRTGGRERDLAVAMIAARILAPGSKLATARRLGGDTLSDTLGELLDLDDADEDELYGAMDWLVERQSAIEQRLAKRHLEDGSVVLYDVSSTYFEGRTCPLARLGHSRDGKRGKLQIVFGLLCNQEGVPVAVEVFAGNTGDPGTLESQIHKLRQRFGLQRVVLVGDRGMLTEARIREDVQPAGLDWISALRGPAIRKLAEAGTLQLSLFDERDLAEITDPENYPGERLVVCRNPALALERARKREELLQATESQLDKVAAAAGRTRNRLQGKDQIGLRVGKVLHKHKMAKHFLLDITDTSFSYQRNLPSIAQEAALDGLYIIRTSVPAHTLGTEQTVRAYKRLSRVERAFRSYKSVDLKVRPIHHRLARRVRAHVFLCLLAYYVEWHMRERLAPLLFDDHDPEGPGTQRPSAAAPARRSTAALAKARSHRTSQGDPVHSFHTLLDDLATVAKNRLQPKSGSKAPPFDLITRPTFLQRKALDLLGVPLECTQ